MATLDLSDQERALMVVMITEAQIPGRVVEQFADLKRKLADGLPDEFMKKVRDGLVTR